MNFYFAQFIIAQNEDIEKWMNILFIAVLAVFWILRSVVKSKVDEAQKRKNKQISLDKSSKPSSSTKELSELLLERVLGRLDSKSGSYHRSNVSTSRTKSVSSRPVNRRITSKSQPDISSTHKFNITKKPTNFSFKQPSVKPSIHKLKKIDTNLQELPEFTPKSVENLADLTLSKSTEKLQSEYISDFVWDYKNPDELKRAIVHYEILGRPLSLRDPSQSLI